MAGLYGEYRHKVDAKGRLSLPAAFRKLLTEDTQLVVVPGAKGQYLSVYTEDAYGEWVDALFARFDDGKGGKGYDARNATHIQMRMKLNASAVANSMDGVGRINLSAKQRTLAGIDKEVVLIGNTDHFDIWDVERWDEFQNSIDLDELLFG